jgi:TetR/AcrR family transcriptional repressor of nem operon
VQGDTADRILESAHALLADRGYSAFSYADIAEMVKIRKASIHHHFPTKAVLVTTVLKQHRHKLGLALKTVTQRIDNPLKRLDAYVLHWEKCIRDKTEPICIAALLGAELPSLPGEETLEQGHSKGIIRLEQSASAEAETFIALMHGAMISARTYGTSKVYTVVMQGALRRLAVHHKSVQT